MKTIISAFLLGLLVSGCALGGNNENKGDLKKSPCAMVTKPGLLVRVNVTTSYGDKLELAKGEIRHHPVTNSPEYRHG